MKFKHVIFASYGNDSIALIQWAKEKGLEDVAVLFSDTGWASKEWPHRVVTCEQWVRKIGYHPNKTTSIGLEELVRVKKGWPRQGMQFCTLELKIKPAMDWLEINDPDKEAICMTGVRREESANRSNHPEMVIESPNHGGRNCWAPLVLINERERDLLIQRAGFKPLPHRSMECFPCINSNRADLMLLAKDEVRIAKIEFIEKSMGHTAKGSPRTMFRPYRYMGATGIRQIIKWAKSPRGKFDPDDGTGSGCDSGFCGI